MKDLFESIGIACCSCGLCCNNRVLCEKCEIATLKANGLPETMQLEIRGLSNIWDGNRTFQYSELYKKIKQLRDSMKITA